MCSKLNNMYDDVVYKVNFSLERNVCIYRMNVCERMIVTLCTVYSTVQFYLKLSSAIH